MSKVYNYMVLAVGLTFLLKFAGIPSGADGLLSYIGLSGNASGISSGAFFIALVALFTLGSATGIAISFFTKSPSETWVIQGIALGIFTVITSTFVSVVNYASGNAPLWIYYIVWMIFIPLLVGFGTSIISWWRGGDS